MKWLKTLGKLVGKGLSGMFVNVAKPEPPPPEPPKDPEPPKVAP